MDQAFMDRLRRLEALALEDDIFGAYHESVQELQDRFEQIARDLPEADMITWVPISAKRLRKRGYDQVQLLARAVGPELGIPVEPLLEKIRDNRANSGLKTPAERRANVLGVYKAVGQEHFRGKRVLLLDDIVTTGATASECARVLLTAGAEEVIFAAVAAAGTTTSK